MSLIHPVGIIFHQDQALLASMQHIIGKLELEKTEDQNIDFGVTRVGGEASRTVSLVNHSKRKIEITFDVENQLQDLKKQFIQIIPNNPITINPR